MSALGDMIRDYEKEIEDLKKGNKRLNACVTMLGEQIEKDKNYIYEQSKIIRNIKGITESCLGFNPKYSSEEAILEILVILNSKEE